MKKTLILKLYEIAQREKRLTTIYVKILNKILAKKIYHSIKNNTPWSNAIFSENTKIVQYEEIY